MLSKTRTRKENCREKKTFDSDNLGIKEMYDIFRE